MNIFHKITLTNLKKNKTRTIVTIIGIILSTAMFYRSYQQHQLSSCIYEGIYH